MSELSAVVAVYGTHTEAEEAVKELQRAGVDMRALSIVLSLIHIWSTSRWKASGSTARTRRMQFTKPVCSASAPL